jgi:gamma-polyglutamate biosynthesis protein CapA
MTEIITDLPEPDETHRRGRIQRRLRREALRAPRDAVVGFLIAALVVGLLQGTSWITGEAAVASPVETGEDTVFSAVMVGDVMFGRHVERAAERHGHDWLLSHVQPLFDADYVTANLEQVVTERVDELPKADKLIHLASDRRGVEALHRAGVTTLALANNHMMDHGIPGLGDTLAALDDIGFEYAGAGLTLDDAVQINYQEHGDLTVATLSFSDAWVAGFVARAFQGGVLSADRNRTTRLISEARLNADLVITHFHWGKEYGFVPDERQRELAELASDAGAHIVIGTHPHVMQAVERIGNTLVLNSLGNFVFDQGFSRTRETALVRYELGSDGIGRVEFVPLEIREGAPRMLAGPLAFYRRARILNRLEGEGLTWTREGGSLFTEIDHRTVLESTDR